MFDRLNLAKRHRKMSLYLNYYRVYFVDSVILSPTVISDWYFVGMA